MGIGILIERWGVFLFIGKNGTAVGKELIGDAIAREDLVEYMVIAVQSLLCIKPGAGNSSGSVINCQMQVPDLSGDPFIGGGIHLLHFAEIRTSGASGMGIFNRYKIGLEEIGFLFGRGLFFFFEESFSDPFFLAFGNFWGKDIFGFQYFCYGRSGDADAFMLMQKLCIMLEIRFIVFCAVEV